MEDGATGNFPHGGALLARHLAHKAQTKIWQRQSLAEADGDGEALRQWVALCNDGAIFLRRTMPAI